MVYKRGALPRLRYTNQKLEISMETKILLVLGILGLLAVGSLEPTESTDTPSTPVIAFDGSYFPKDFMWGVATSAYQTEGAANQHGRGPSTWDTFAHEFPERIDDGSNGDVAVNYYAYYKEDLARMKNDLGVDAFRFSISWPRIIPSGTLREGVNEEGIAFYNSVIDEALRLGLIPFVTLFHWDVPQALEDKYGGFRSPNIIADFEDYAKLCYERFGDRVKHWLTINEPYVFTVHGYEIGGLAPGRCSSWVNRACQEGDSGTEPYIVGHHVLLAHAVAYRAYKAMGQDGEIGITLDLTWPEPYDFSVAADRAAAQRNLDFAFGWFMDPLVYGYYPRIMQQLVTGNRLPEFTKKEIVSLKGSYDFIGINYYTANYASPNTSAPSDPTHIRYATDGHYNLTKYREGKPIGEQVSPSWLYVFPEGLRYVLNYTKDAYKNPIIYVTENGIGDNNALSPEETVNDTWRINYFKSHVWNVLKSICDHGVNVKGYFAWSFIDNYEWSNGYTVRMGLYGVDRAKSLDRFPKNSVAWWKEFLSKKPSSDGPKCISPKKKTSIDDEL
ncbi:beta-glucosidase 12-like [Mercurialis annua]|uniref:beta-glucosidase 12-like n=1 Tax=Mercurialis annua TaxID=3986 RepID=UPI0021600D47|nr:beta-glucosidase 12-like [Mercurialis annua]